MSVIFIVLSNATEFQPHKIKMKISQY